MLWRLTTGQLCVKTSPAKRLAGWTRVSWRVAERYRVLDRTVNKAPLSCDCFFNRLLLIIFFSVLPISILITRSPCASEWWYQVMVTLGLCRAGSVPLPALLMRAKSQSYALLNFFHLFFICFTDDPVVTEVVPRSGQSHCYLGNKAASKLNEINDFSPSCYFCYCAARVCMWVYGWLCVREMDSWREIFHNTFLFYLRRGYILSDFYQRWHQK